MLLRLRDGASLCRDRDGHEPSGRDPLSHRARAARRSRWSTTPASPTSASSARATRSRAPKARSTKGSRTTGIALINADDAFAGFWRDLNRGPSLSLTFALERSGEVTAQHALTANGSLLAMRTPAGEYSRCACKSRGCTTCATRSPPLRRPTRSASRRPTIAAGLGELHRRPRAGCSARPMRAGASVDRRQLQRESRFGAKRPSPCWPARRASACS